MRNDSRASQNITEACRQLGIPLSEITENEVPLDLLAWYLARAVGAAYLNGPVGPPTDGEAKLSALVLMHRLDGVAEMLRELSARWKPPHRFKGDGRYGS